MSKLLDPKRGDKYPFEYRDSASTDIRLLFGRLQPNWNKKPAPETPPTNVEQIRLKGRTRGES